MSNQQAGYIAGNAAAGNQSVGQPKFHLNGSAAGNPPNWLGGGNAGVGVKVWESSNQALSVGVGVNYGQSFGRQNGQSFKSRPDVGAGIGFRFRF